MGFQQQCGSRSKEHPQQTASSPIIPSRTLSGAHWSVIANGEWMGVDAGGGIASLKFFFASLQNSKSISKSCCDLPPSSVSFQSVLASPFQITRSSISENRIFFLSVSRSLSLSFLTSSSLVLILIFPEEINADRLCPLLLVYLLLSQSILSRIPQQRGLYIEGKLNE